MDTIERMQETVTRLFGPTARLCGNMGSGNGPGHIEIRVGSVAVGRGFTLGDAIRAASAALARWASTEKRLAGRCDWPNSLWIPFRDDTTSVTHCLETERRISTDQTGQAKIRSTPIRLCLCNRQNRQTHFSERT